MPLSSVGIVPLPKLSRGALWGWVRTRVPTILDFLYYIVYGMSIIYAIFVMR